MCKYIYIYIVKNQKENSAKTLGELKVQMDNFVEAMEKQKGSRQHAGEWQIAIEIDKEIISQAMKVCDVLSSLSEELDAPPSSESPNQNHRKILIQKICQKLILIKEEFFQLRAERVEMSISQYEEFTNVCSKLTSYSKTSANEENWKCFFKIVDDELKTSSGQHNENEKSMVQILDELYSLLKRISAFGRKPPIEFPDLPPSLIKLSFTLSTMPSTTSGTTDLSTQDIDASATAPEACVCLAILSKQAEIV